MKNGLLALLWLMPLLLPAQGTRTESVLAGGTWYKIAVTRTGIQQVTYQDLVGLGMDPASINPENLRVYGNGGAMLPEMIGKERTEDLRENPVLMHDGGDGTFGEGDFLLFYGEGADRIRYNTDTKLFDHERNIYSDTAVYFINADKGPGKRIPVVPSSTQPPNSYSTRYADFYYHDLDMRNLIRSGKIWVGEEFNDTITEFRYRWVFPDIDTSSAIRFTAHVVARCPLVSFFYLYVNDSLADDIQMDFTDLQSVTTYARPKLKSSLFFYPKDTLDIRLSYPLLTTSSTGWLNYLEMNFQRRLVWHGPMMAFRDPNSIGPNKVTEFRMTGTSGNLTLWDVTNPDSVRIIEPLQNDTLFRFRISTDQLRQFIAFDGSGYHPVKPLGPVENQNLRGTIPAQLVVITPPIFETQARALATYHAEHGGITSLVMRTDKIYNEFSSGQQDLTAIRDFIKMLYDNGGSNRPRFVLLYGDGSFDYKDRLPNNTNFVPTYESTESFKYLGTFVTDDYFGLMNQGEGEESAGSLELGIGRLPVMNIAEAEAVNRKIMHYYDKTDTTLSSWRNGITFIADDEDGNLHVEQAEELSDIVNTRFPQFNVSKIYSDAFQLVEIPSGVRYPDANTAINQAVADGNLIINYNGHGGETGWSGEMILTIPDIESWSNVDKLPVFVTATCEFSRFDNPERYSAGEMIITKPDGGAIALFTTTRLAQANANQRLDTAFFHHLMDIGQDGKYLRMGELIRVAKNMNANNASIRNFVLLGDPAQSIAFPEYRIETLTINGTPAGLPDTAMGLQMVEVTGRITDGLGTPQAGFAGEVEVTVYDKPVTYTTLGNQSKSFPQPFQARNSVLFDGRASVTGGIFSFVFPLPHDVNLQYGRGKISYYAKNGETDATGESFDLVIGGVDPGINPENEGPAISLFMDDRTFTDNSRTGLSPVLIADLYDTNGINSFGLGIGHEILMILDGNQAHPVVLNGYYAQETDQYQRGTVFYPTGELAPGRHTLTLQAWDLYNNVSEKTISFYAFADPSLTVSGVSNFPNPFRDGTTFTFQPEPGSGDLEVQIDITNLTGQPVKSISLNYPEPSLQGYIHYWNGCDDHGNPLRSGLYPYRIRFTNELGSISQTSGKLIIIR